MASFLASLLTGLATGLGSFLLLFKKEFPKSTIGVLLGFAAGIMLAASFFSLLLPALETGGIFLTALGFLTGSLFVYFLDRLIPHFHPASGTEGPKSDLNKIWLFILAITIHNFPEGMAVGIGFLEKDITKALSLALGIGLQNIPEGLSVAVSLVGFSFSTWKIIGITFLTGLAEPVGGVIGAFLGSLSGSILPFALSLAAGAMIYVISDEIIPETHAKGGESLATFGVIFGFLLMMVFDNLSF
ncbi:ZIP family metal transporter [Carboxydothermus ferrireducens]|uniref:ZIP family zinc transporter n=1 Tax=Carboxydothermus ferrireducens DSM 11255 TaxID=1119529 RepID=A0ABX2RDR1_9THEO|nr:ZIP family metal transporter [Carboxydothermus ferrireducens]NYE58032.1 ZIP family zinc transporter [Carboxydothermus ferrireducens DSM 11255]